MKAQTVRQSRAMGSPSRAASVVGGGAAWGGADGPIISFCSCSVQSAPHQPHASALARAHFRPSRASLSGAACSAGLCMALQGRTSPANTLCSTTRTCQTCWQQRRGESGTSHRRHATRVRGHCLLVTCGEQRRGVSLPGSWPGLCIPPHLHPTTTTTTTARHPS